MKKRKIAIKLSTLILITMMVLIVLSVFATDMVLKDVYNKRDKNDLYWNYTKILEQPYKYLKIDGGNITNIIFEPGKKSSVRVLKQWRNFHDDTSINAYVKNDTLYLKLKFNNYKNINEKQWMEGQVLVRLFGPQLLTVDGNNTNVELQKLRQANININLKGNSRLEVETYSHNFDTLKVAQQDSSQVVFEMSPDLSGSYMMHFNHVFAALQGVTLLDIGRSTVDDIKLNVADSSAVILSGKSLKGINSNSFSK
jgi:hypothetical protein